MKILIVINLLQTLGIVAVIFMLGVAHTQLTSLTPALSITASAQDERKTSTSDGAAQSLDEARLRKIIREELLAWQTADSHKQQRVVQSNAAVDTRDEQSLRNRRDSVAQKIQTYKSAGAITRQQMQDLQVEIAQLDEQSRTQMLSMLVMSINAGAIKD